VLSLICRFAEYQRADYQLAESLNLEGKSFPALEIYERLLPAVVEELSEIFYHRGSPYSGEGILTTDKSYGDLHQWYASI
jgi:beta-mannosidase